MTLPCTRPSTMNWLNKIHKENLVLESERPLNAKQCLEGNKKDMKKAPINFENVLTSLCRLSSTLENHHEREIKVKEENRRKKTKKNLTSYLRFKRTQFAPLQLKETRMMMILRS